jgi:transposase
VRRHARRLLPRDTAGAIVKPTYKPITDLEWEMVHAFFEYSEQGHGRPRGDVRAAVNAVLHVLTVKCGWDGLPGDHGYPSPPTVRRRHYEWKDSGALDKAMAILRDGGRRFEPHAPMCAIKRPSDLLPVVAEENPVPQTPVVRVSTLYRAVETLEAMQLVAQQRLLAGIPANWKVSDEPVHS